MDASLPHTPETIASLSTKMDAWAASLTPEEQRALRHALVGPTEVDLFSGELWNAGLASFAIQNLMSQYNEAQTLASSVLKKKDDTANAVIGKI